MKKIGITQRVILNKNGSRVDSLEQDYIRYYSNFGINLIPIPNVISNISKYIQDFGIEMIILSGGGDINTLPKDVTCVDELNQLERDITEAELLKYAVKNKMSVFGECRGSQFINGFFGGSLIKNIKDNLSGSLNHIGCNHKIEIIDDKFKTFFPSDFIEVNSFHQDGFTKKELSLQLKPFAMASDGIIEGFYHPELPITGIMWHPERMVKDEWMNNKFIENLLNKIQ